ncbi:MAG: 16S rRNA (guanine(527)-N(7))-methyltransferase RsmG [Mogibacterium sp.]|nr:16S rRNA (guanine(527)-N(7))-methyltransferase RsmG [Mogibacterium sp.]
MTDLIIKELKEKYGESTADKLLSYLDMVLERNEHINLTAVRDRDEAIVKHVLDSFAICDLPEYKAAKTVIDVGTGAGFPGALLAIVSPEKEFTLLDSTLKRLRVIDEFAEALGISNLKTVHARAEEINRKPEYSGAYDLCVSRAVANLDTLSKWCLPFVRKGGSFIAYKGENYNEELEGANKTLRKLGGKLDRVETYPGEPEDISGHVLLIISKK